MQVGLRRWKQVSAVTSVVQSRRSPDRPAALRGPARSLWSRYQAERVARRAVNNLNLVPGWQMKDLVGKVARRRGRPLLIRRFEGATGERQIYGLWVATLNADIIFVRSDTTERHAQHITMHEVGHIMLGHGPAPGEDKSLVEVANQLLPDLAPELVEKTLGREQYDCRQELEAEIFADLTMSMTCAHPLNRGDGVAAQLENIVWG